MEQVGKIIMLFLLSSVKFAFAPAFGAITNFSFWETIGITILGGVFGVFFFYYLGAKVVNQVLDYVFGSIGIKASSKKKKKFTWKNKLLISTKMKYGLIGLSLLTPCFLSIPFGCVLAARYFQGDSRTLPFMLASVVFWSFVLTAFAFFVKPLFV